MSEQDLKEYKIRPLPTKDCTFQGVVDCCGRICCDSIGTDISPEFCFYCRYHSTISKMKPCDFAEKFNEWLISNDFKASAESNRCKYCNEVIFKDSHKEEDCAMKPLPKPCPCKCHTTIHHALFHDGDICPECGNKRGRAS